MSLENAVTVGEGTVFSIASTLPSSNERPCVSTNMVGTAHVDQGGARPKQRVPKPSQASTPTTAARSASEHRSRDQGVSTPSQVLIPFLYG